MVNCRHCSLRDAVVWSKAGGASEAKTTLGYSSANRNPWPGLEPEGYGVGEWVGVWLGVRVGRWLGWVGELVGGCVGE